MKRITLIIAVLLITISVSAQLSNFINNCKINPNLAPDGTCDASSLIDTWYSDGYAQLNYLGSVQLDYIINVNEHHILPNTLK